MRWSRFFLWGIAITIAGTIGGAILFPMAASWLPFPVPRIDETVATGVMALGFSILGLGCSTVLERGRLVGLMYSGIIVGAIALICAFGVLVSQPRNNEMLWISVTLWPTYWACWVMLFGLLMLPKLHGLASLLRVLTIIVLGLFGAYICLGFTLYPEIPVSNDPQALSAAYKWQRDYEDTVLRIGAMFAMSSGACMVLMLMTVWVPRLTGHSLPTGPSKPYWARCPRCACEQTIHTGVSHCETCGLRIKVELT